MAINYNDPFGELNSHGYDSVFPALRTKDTYCDRETYRVYSIPKSNDMHGLEAAMIRNMYRITLELLKAQTGEGNDTRIMLDEMVKRFKFLKNT